MAPEGHYLYPSWRLSRRPARTGRPNLGGDGGSGDGGRSEHLTRPRSLARIAEGRCLGNVPQPFNFAATAWDCSRAAA